MSRDTLEILNIVRYLKERGISMHFENEKLDPKFPVSWLRMHPDVEFIIDEATAAEIQEDALEYYREK